MYIYSILPHKKVELFTERVASRYDTYEMLNKLFHTVILNNGGIFNIIVYVINMSRNIVKIINMQNFI